MYEFDRDIDLIIDNEVLSAGKAPPTTLQSYWAPSALPRRSARVFPGLFFGPSWRGLTNASPEQTKALVRTVVQPDRANRKARAASQFWNNRSRILGSNLVPRKPSTYLRIPFGSQDSL